MTSGLARFVAAAGLALALAGAQAQPPDLDAHRQRWQAAGIASYRYAYRKYCECQPKEPPRTFVTVRDGRVADVFHVHPDSDRQVPARSGSLEYYWTIDDLFDLLETAAAGDAVVRMQFHETLGYPILVYVDYDPALFGDEVDVRVTELEPGER